MFLCVTVCVWETKKSFFSLVAIVSRLLVFFKFHLFERRFFAEIIEIFSVIIVAPKRNFEQPFSTLIFFSRFWSSFLLFSFFFLCFFLPFSFFSFSLSLSLSLCFYLSFSLTHSHNFAFCICFSISLSLLFMFSRFLSLSLFLFFLVSVSRSFSLFLFLYRICSPLFLSNFTFLFLETLFAEYIDCPKIE